MHRDNSCTKFGVHLPKLDAVNSFIFPLGLFFLFFFLPSVKLICIKFGTFGGLFCTSGSSFQEHSSLVLHSVGFCCVFFSNIVIISTNYISMYSAICRKNYNEFYSTSECKITVPAVSTVSHQFKENITVSA